MTDRHFEHGKLQVASKSSGLSLSLYSSLIICVPATFTDPFTLNDLPHLSSTGRLRVAKGSPCRLDITLSTEGVDAKLHALQVGANSIIECSVWKNPPVPYPRIILLTRLALGRIGPPNLDRVGRDLVCYVTLPAYVFGSWVYGRILRVPTSIGRSLCQFSKNQLRIRVPCQGFSKNQSRRFERAAT